MLTKVTTFCKAHGIHCWFVAHPAKLYPKEDGTYPVPKGMSISGSAAWFAKADCGITVHRLGEHIEVHSWKCRFKWIGSVGSSKLTYDPVTGRYKDFVEWEEAANNPVRSVRNFNETEDEWDI